MRGSRFPLEELPVAITRVIPQMNRSGTLDGIVKLPRRWDLVIEKQDIILKDCKEIL